MGIPATNSQSHGQFLSSKKILNKDVAVPPPKKENPKSKP
jgi:hypothetical protein